MDITLRFSDEVKPPVGINDHVSAFIAFQWGTSGQVFDGVDANGYRESVAHLPFSCHHVLNQHNIEVDADHSYDIKGARAEIWHTEEFLYGAIKFDTPRNLMQIRARIERGEYAAISPRLLIDKATYENVDGETVKVIESCNITAISLCKASANPCSRIWIQSYSMEKPAGGDRFHAQWTDYVKAFHADPVRTATANIAWNRFAGAY